LSCWGTAPGTGSISNDVGRYHAVIHPDDLPYMYEAEISMFHFLKNIRGEEKKDYKLVYDFRVRHRNGSYIRFLHQLIPFELDRDFNSWVLLIIPDVLSSYPENARPRRFLLNAKTGKVCLFNEEIGIRSKLPTKRETEVLDLVSQGFSSEDISDRLCVSTYTVNNHRRNVLVKTNTRNITQAITYVRRIGLL